MKEIKLSNKQYDEIKSTATTMWVTSNKGENDLVFAVISSFINFCNRNNYVIQNGKVLEANEEKQEHHK